MPIVFVSSPESASARPASSAALPQTHPARIDLCPTEPIDITEIARLLLL